jgi:hypothetical protein
VAAYLLDWVNLLLRWAHVITAIAWIGSSFYFVWLDNSLTPPTDPTCKAKGVDGELWAVHGGGFYNPQKYMVAPSCPKHLHWFYWESYSTWLTGFALFTVLYLFNAGTFLIDKSGARLAAGGAVAAALGFLVGFWLVYDAICRTVGRTPERRPDRGRAGGAGGAGVLGGLPAVCRPRRLPAGGRDDGHGHERQRVLLDHPGPAQGGRGHEGRPAGGPGARPARQAAQRAQHLLHAAGAGAMLSNHYGWLYQAPHNWLVLVLMMLAGALIRHSFVARHKAHVAGQARPLGARRRRHRGDLLGPGRLAGAPPPAAPRRRCGHRRSLRPGAGGGEQRCVLCHNAQLGLQHVLVMYAGAMAVPLIVGPRAQAHARAGGHADLGRPVLLRPGHADPVAGRHAVVRHQAAGDDGRDLCRRRPDGGHGQPTRARRRAAIFGAIIGAGVISILIAPHGQPHAALLSRRWSPAPSSPSSASA